MLRRDRQVRLQVHQWIDGCIFALGLWVSHAIRRTIGYGIHWQGINFQADPIGDFSQYFWLFLILIPMAPLVLEWQGYYANPIFAPRSQRAWQLSKACISCTVGLILVEAFLRRPTARGVFVLFGLCTFVFMMLKEEALQWAYASKLGKAQFKKRVVLVGSPDDTLRLRKELRHNMNELDIVGEIDLNDTSVGNLVSCLHEQSVNMVVLTARHTLFGTIEKAIQACELEGVEAWLVADFFQTHVSRTSLDDFFGRPVLVFHSGPDLAWSRLVKQIMDFIGAVCLLIVLSPLLVIAAILVKFSGTGKKSRAGALSYRKPVPCEGPVNRQGARQ